MKRTISDYIIESIVTEASDNLDAAGSEIASAVIDDIVDGTEEAKKKAQKYWTNAPAEFTIYNNGAKNVGYSITWKMLSRLYDNLTHAYYAVTGDGDIERKAEVELAPTVAFEMCPENFYYENDNTLRAIDKPGDSWNPVKRAKRIPRIMTKEFFLPECFCDGGRTSLRESNRFADFIRENYHRFMGKGKEYFKSGKVKCKVEVKTLDRDPQTEPNPKYHSNLPYVIITPMSEEYLKDREEKLKEMTDPDILAKADAERNKADLKREKRDYEKEMEELKSKEEDKNARKAYRKAEIKALVDRRNKMRAAGMSNEEIKNKLDYEKHEKFIRDYMGYGTGRYTGD